MSKVDKLKDKLRGDGSFTWSELVSLIKKLKWETKQYMRAQVIDKLELAGDL
jgi:hypothetical protein